MAKIDHEFRQVFAGMAPQAIINRDELAALLATTVGAVTQMAYRGELPPTAFPAKRRACWFVGDIREWLDDAASRRTKDGVVAHESVQKPRAGRPRLPTNGAI
ncbi:hypothetical protein NYD60_16400 [Burkholderia thailandensis]|uniref:hypothetical protein n=1 Tax=Burkholderia thailandensis TaxID=57975 RepID=UPI0012D8E308|nr:hypothetical protein [Burkholderia thailandensis]MCS6473748.1 hypothetical protein [Burkholderia thailandensis]MCS6501588.1 hypothetical protein [Burkholderia thailandensis]MUV22907.1 hypothetical protein [Burkholderia thailandensis]